MVKMSPILLGLSLALAGASLAPAQDASTAPSLPLVLQITREYVKPYKEGMAHDKTESAFIATMNKAKFPAYYVGLDSLSGRSRALFLTRYASFAEWEQDNKIVAKDHTLAAAIERDELADGELLDEVDSAVYTYNAGLSYSVHPDITHARYMEITVFKVKLGHRAGWHELMKMVKDANDKAGSSSHWACYEIAYGADDGTYILLSADKSMSDIDDGFAEGKKFVEAMGGEEGMKKLDALYGETVESSHSELFSINPNQSYLPAEWIKADPAFWTHKPPAN
ncbi:MAG TPA: hypothetical protein VE291_07080 [Terracidiphilus sp.]|jgi:hypothetical protein|nr:hypothetical protein [Terracidiphilus sp.]